MKKFLAALLVVVVLFTVTVPKITAKADGLTLAALAGGAYAIASASGMNFAFTGYNGQSASEWMQSRINSWLGGHTIAEKFGTEAIRLNTGKLLIPSAAVAGIVSFLNDLISKTGLTDNMSTPVNMGIIYDGNYINPYVYYGSNPTGKKIPNVVLMVVHSAPLEGKVCAVEGLVNGNRSICVYDASGELKGSRQITDSSYTSFAFLAYASRNTTTDAMVFLGINKNTGASGSVSWSEAYRFNFTETGKRQTAIIPGTYTPPEGLNDLQSWEGDVSGGSDTNLEQLLQDIFDKIADGTLDVIGDVVDTPADPTYPENTPMPTAAPGDVIGGLDTISGQLEGIDNTLTGVQEGVGEAVGQLEGINEGIGSISEALEVPTSSEAPNFKFDLTTLFPFCIPFDIYRFVTMFSASPVAPHVQIPFNIPAINLNYTFDLDFSSFDSVASVLRSVELIAFCVGLAILTSKVIRW